MKVNGFIKVIFFISTIIVIISGCEKETGIEKEQRLLQEYLMDHNITAEATYSGLYYIETQHGRGAEANGGDEVRVRYKGTLLDGTVFDSGVITFVLGMGKVIQGWDEGINYMNEGGKAILIIPSSLAYGSKGQGDIPGYSTLIFEVELLNII